ncbi:MAG: gliding motility-associated-like protein [Flammeovirgaceae bacterium]|jgi:gliding motility-associated-like protein
MRKIVFLTIICLATFTLPTLAQNEFIENKNQWDERVLFRANLPSASFLFLEQTAMTYLLYDPATLPQHPNGNEGSSTLKSGNSLNSVPEPIAVKGHVVRVEFEGANLNSEFQTAKPTSGHSNFLLGNDPSKWGKKAKGYQEVVYSEIYDKVDLKFLQQENTLKYEFRVKPQGNPQQISLAYDGQDEMYLHNGNLYIKTSVGVIQEMRPYSYQIIDGLELEVESAFKLEGNRVTFLLPDGYDKKYELIIDPTLIFSTYSGSTQDNWGFTATPDNEGNFYAGGMTFQTGTGFPITTGAFQELPSDSLTTSVTDIAIIKYNQLGTVIEYATYLGGTEMDLPHSLIVNSQNQLVIIGSTGSADFPTLPSSYDNNFEGGTLRFPFGSFSLPYSNGSDMFLAILSEDGSTLVGSTYFGGTENDGLNDSQNSILNKNYGDVFRGDLVLDVDDNIYICSVTESDGLATFGSFQSDLKGDLDGIVAKFNPLLTNMEWATYLGGDGIDATYGITINNSKQAIVVGGTNSTNFPTTAGVLNPNYLGGNTDGFISVLSVDGRNLIASSFLGTGEYDQAYLVDIDKNSAGIGVFGQTEGKYLVSDDVFSNPNSGQFIHKISEDLTTTIASTVYGSGNNSSTDVRINIRPTAFQFSDCGFIYAGGWGGSTNSGFAGGTTTGMPTSANPIRSTTDGSDFHYIVLSENFESILYATYFGSTFGGSGAHVDGGTNRFDSQGVIYQSVCSCGGSRDGFPTTAGVVSNTNNSPISNGSIRCNNASFKLDLGSILAAISPTIDSAGVRIPQDEGCAPLEIIFLDSGIIGADFLWRFGDGDSLFLIENREVEHTYQNPGEYFVTLTVTDSLTCQQSTFAVDTITVFPADFSAMGDASLCVSESAQLSASGGDSYTWSPSLGLTDSTISNPIATPDTTTNYTILVQTDKGCEETFDIRVQVNPVNAKFDTTFTEACARFPNLRVITESQSISQTYTWTLNGNPYNPPNNNDFEVDLPAEGNYILILEMENNGCTDSDTVNFDVKAFDANPFFGNFKISEDQEICLGDTVELFAGGGVNYQWLPTINLSSATDSIIDAFPTETTKYKVRISSERAACFVDDSVTITVSVKPELAIDYKTKDVECGAFPQFIFENNSTNATNYSWVFSTGQIFSSEQIGTFIPDQEGNLTVTLQSNNSICADSIGLVIPINRIGLPPNAFSPNGDGVNETFEITNIQQGWQLEIYNRWGKTVLKTDNYKNDWVGGDNGGEVFYYLLTSPEGNSCRGTIHVLK